MAKKRPRPKHLTTSATPPDNRTIRVFSPATWHIAPLDLVTLPEAQVASLVAGRPTFDDEVVLARQYHAWSFNSRQSLVTCDLAKELSDRVEQLNFLLKSVYVILPRFFGRPKQGDFESHKLSYYADFLLSLYTESFYYVAHRLQKVCGDRDNCLPHLDNYARVEEIQIVRNQLLEHPEGPDSGVTTRSWNVASDVGPMVKGARRPDQPDVHRDPGLFANAESLKHSLSEALKAALNRIGEEPVNYAPFVEYRNP